jgi:hypothetical protein
MTPKEKADELVHNFRVNVVDEFEPTNSISNHKAKQCALIAVNEIIQSDPIMPIDLDCPSKSSLKYWREVKQEIQNKH